MATQIGTSVRLDADFHAALKARAKHEDRSLAALIRVALRHYLDNGES